MNAGELTRLGRERLAGLSPSAALDVRLLLCEVLTMTAAELFRAPERQVSDGEEQTFVALLDRRAAGEPLAYLLGYREFYGERFKVTSATLIPRPDTELLVARALELLPAQEALSLADLGTGSGAIAVTLARLRPNWQLLAIDQSEAALAVAQENAAGLSNISVRLGDWLDGSDERFAAIVCNPPYIDAADPHLQAGDVRFEPLSALVAEEAGLADLRQVTQQAITHLQPGGWLLFEHGWQQAQAVRELLSAAGFVEVASHRDLAGHERVTEGRRC